MFHRVSQLFFVLSKIISPLVYSIMIDSLKKLDHSIAAQSPNAQKLKAVIDQHFPGFQGKVLQIKDL